MQTQNKIKPAPSFPNRSNTKKGGEVYRYPQDGRLIGPAWELAWELISRAASPVPLVELARVVTAMRGDIAEGTTVSLLHHAVEAGVIHSARVKKAGPPKLVISVKPVDVAEASDVLPPAWRVVREVMTTGGPMPRTDVRDLAMSMDPYLYASQFNGMWSTMARRNMVVSDDEGQTWRWAK